MSGSPFTLALFWRDFVRGMGGAWLLLRGDARQGLTYFEASYEGAQRSLGALLVVMPFYVWALRYVETLSFSGVTMFVLIQVIGWLTLIMVMKPIVDVWGCASRYLLFVSVYNWCRAFRGIVFYLVYVWTYPLMHMGSESFLESGPFPQLALFVFLCAVLVYQWFVAKAALSVNFGRAFLVVLLEAFVEFCVSIVFHGLFMVGGR
ncbi:MAG: hypothetical protein GDA54_00655 [Alphaproteobacteria bacterium GM7ARS4]|nr:hypothetical protein [Alphaproteobacteria bacterium GM7ARS4]